MFGDTTHGNNAQSWNLGFREIFWIAANEVRRMRKTKNGEAESQTKRELKLKIEEPIRLFILTPL